MGGHYRGSAAERRALDAFIKLYRAAETLSSTLARGLVEENLSEAQFGVMDALYHLGPLCQADLAKKILRSTGNMTLVIDKLEERGLVKRKRETLDRRYVSVELTPAGKRLIERALPDHVDRLTNAMSALSASEQDELARLCRKLGLKVAEASGR